MLSRVQIITMNLIILQFSLYFSIVYSYIIFDIFPNFSTELIIERYGITSQDVRDYDFSRFYDLYKVDLSVNDLTLFPDLLEVKGK